MIRRAVKDVACLVGLMVGLGMAAVYRWVRPCQSCSGSGLVELSDGYGYESRFCEACDGWGF